MNERGSARLLLIGWLVCLVGGVAAAGVFVAGVLRDTHFGEARLAMDLGRSGPWQSTDFRVWEDGTHVLWLSSLGPQAPFDPSRPAADTVPSVRFTGRLQLRVLGPGGESIREITYDGTDPAHVVGEGMTWTRVAELELRDSPLRTWRLEARVRQADSVFAGRPDLTSRLLLRKDREPAGMGGLITYAMMVPAAALLLASLAFGLAAARGGATRAPAWISGIAVVAFGLLLMR